MIKKIIIIALITLILTILMVVIQTGDDVETETLTTESGGGCETPDSPINLSLPPNERPNRPPCILNI